MENIRKYVTPLILVIALFAINGSEFLHHHDLSETKSLDDKCQACIFNHSLNSTLVEQVYLFTPQALTYESIINIFNPVLQSEWFITTPGRAPPPVSHI